MNTDRPKRRTYPVRADGDLLDALSVWAKLQGRTLAEEIRLAISVHVRAHVLNALDYPEGRARAEAEGVDPDELAATVIAQLAETRGEVFGRPRGLFGNGGSMN